ncbi:MAG: alpha/beta fold hydrolase [bacterium]
MSLPEPDRVYRIAGHQLELSVLELGPIAPPCVVMLHGLRDSAHSLLPVAQMISQSGAGLRVLLADLRGHGHSEVAQAYGMPEYLLDLLAVVEHGCNSSSQARVALFGHSLGGQIASRFSALFPEKVSALIMVEGMGPPKRPNEGDPAQELISYRTSLLQRGALKRGGGRPLNDHADATARLLRNNPRLATDLAEHIARHLTTTINNQLHWNFDPQARNVFLGVNTADNTKYWQQLKAPTCIISGTLSYQYWGRELAENGFTGHFAEGEMEQRAALIPNHEHHWFDQSGHMVHYDEPERLGEVSSLFLKHCLQEQHDE